MKDASVFTLGQLGAMALLVITAFPGLKSIFTAMIRKAKEG